MDRVYECDKYEIEICPKNPLPGNKAERQHINCGNVWNLGCDKKTKKTAPRRRGYMRVVLICYGKKPFLKTQHMPFHASMLKRFPLWHSWKRIKQILDFFCSNKMAGTSIPGSLWLITWWLEVSIYTSDFDFLEERTSYL